MNNFHSIELLNLQNQKPWYEPGFCVERYLIVISGHGNYPYNDIYRIQAIKRFFGGIFGLFL